MWEDGHSVGSISFQHLDKRWLLEGIHQSWSAKDFVCSIQGCAGRCLRELAKAELSTFSIVNVKQVAGRVSRMVPSQKPQRRTCDPWNTLESGNGDVPLRQGRALWYADHNYVH